MLNQRMVAAALLAGMVGLATPACTGTYYRGYAVTTPRVNDRAFNQGYRDGLDEGRSDARHHHRFEPERAGRYRSADHSYNRRYGPFPEYQRAYRSGFREGYERGFRDYRR